MGLVQGNVKYYLTDVLAKCHETKSTVYSTVLNIVITVLLITVGTTILYTCYKSKPSKEEEYNKMIHDQQYVLEQIRFYNQMQGEKKSSSKITDLPNGGPMDF